MEFAAARACDHDVEDGGWLKKLPTLQLDEREDDLADLRKAVQADQPDGFAGMTEAERKALVQTSPEHAGEVRSPLHPRHIRFDSSLSSLRLLGDRQPEPKATAKRRRRPSRHGNEDLARNQTQARAKALKMLSEARELGVPLPSADKLTVPRHTRHG